MRFLLDCNALSEQVKPRPDPGLMHWAIQNEAGSAISELTIAEICKGAFARPPGKRRDATFAWIAEIEMAFEGRTLAVNMSVLKCWGRLCGEHERRGRRLPVMDSLLAATALVHDITIITRNTADFPSEVRTLNPWKK